MNNIFKIILSLIIIINLSNNSFAKESFFDEALKFYNDKKYEKAKFLFERSIAYNPKDSNSYLYLAKIYNHKDDEKNEEKNLETTLLIEPNNEEAILMSMKVALNKTNYSKVKDFSERFKKVCKKLCDKSDKILNELANLEPKNES